MNQPIIKGTVSSTKIRVLLCSTLYYPNIGGVENSLHYLSRAYREMGFVPWILVSTGGDPNATGKFVEIGRMNGTPTIRYRFSRVALIRLLRVTMVLRGLKCRGRWETMIARDQHSAVGAVVLGLPCVYVVPGLSAEQHRPTGWNPFRWINHLCSVAMQRLALTKVDTVAVFSEHMARAIERTSGRTDSLWVRPGVDAERFRPLPTDAKAERRKSLGLDPNSTIAVAVGRLARPKRFDLALEALRHAPETWQLVIVGDGPLAGVLREYAAREGLGNRLSFTGKVPDPERYLQAADVYLHSSDHESFGQVLIEAMACGLPIAAFDPRVQGVATATSEVVPHRWLRTANDLSGPALSRAMEAACGLQQERDEIAEWAHSQFSWTVLADELRRVVRQPDKERQNEAH